MKRLILLVLAAVALFGADGQVAKSPYEMIDLSLDFVNRAASGVTLVSVQVLDSSEADVSSTMLVQTPDTPVPAVFPASSKVIFRIKNGSIGGVYNIIVRVSKTDTGEKLEGNVVLHVNKKI